MATIAGESPEEKPNNYSVEERIPNIPWIGYALQQAQFAQETIETSVENAIQSTRSRVNRIITTSAAHFNQTIVSVQIQLLLLLVS